MILPPPPFLSYKVLISDCPWHHDTYSDAGQEKGASQHYDTMPTPDIIALFEPLNLEWIMAPDCIHIMWTTWAHLARGDAHAVMAGWKFKCVSGGAWFKKTKHGKDGFGMGRMFRDSCEPYLIGTRGDPGMAKIGNRNWRNGFEAKLQEHSRKPDYLHRAVEKMYPGGAYLELFGRASRPGWTVWGKEAEKFDEPADTGDRGRQGARSRSASDPGDRGRHGRQGGPDLRADTTEEVFGGLARQR